MSTRDPVPNGRSDPNQLPAKAQQGNEEGEAPAQPIEMRAFLAAVLDSTPEVSRELAEQLFRLAVDTGPNRAARIRRLFEEAAGG
jgi:hypothetical protein